MIKITEFDYALPKNLIATEPANPRDASRLLVFETEKSNIHHQIFSELTNFLNPGDLVIVNNSKVMPARLFGRKKSGGKIEILLLEKLGKYWNILIGGKILVGETIIFDHELEAQVIAKNGKSGMVEFNLSDKMFRQKIDQIGKTPIPPYIKNQTLSEKALRNEYQTIYAKKYGSAAAPTAGLHFTKKLIGDLEAAGIQFAPIDLHVGLGTFDPIGDEEIKTKKLHSENFSIPHSTVEKILATKKSGNRIIAVGTTTVRALESSAERILSDDKNIIGKTDIFIQPGDKFQIVDGLITNFHLPQSSLMMLVAAFIQSKTNFDGREKLLELYQIAISKKYRFYSFGNAMLII